MYACIQKLQSPLHKEFQDILDNVLIRITSKESTEDENSKANLVQFLWHVVVPLYTLQNRSYS